MSEPYELIPAGAGKPGNGRSVFYRHSLALNHAGAWWARQFKSRGGASFMMFGPMILLFVAFVAIKYTIWAAGAAVLLAVWILTMLADALWCGFAGMMDLPARIRDWR